MFRPGEHKIPNIVLIAAIERGFLLSALVPHVFEDSSSQGLILFLLTKAFERNDYHALDLVLSEYYTRKIVPFFKVYSLLMDESKKMPHPRESVIHFFIFTLCTYDTTSISALTRYLLVEFVTQRAPTDLLEALLLKLAEKPQDPELIRAITRLMVKSVSMYNSRSK